MSKLYKFYADWCGPCKAYSPVVEDVVSEFGITKEDINIDDNPEMPGQYKIRSIPSLVLVKDDGMVHTLTGTLSREELKNALSKLL